MRRRFVRKLGRCRQGASAVEFALIAPVLLLLTAGIVELGAALSVYRATNLLATQYAIAWADCKDDPAGTCSTELATYTSASSVTNVAPKLKSSQLTLRMFQVSMASTGSPPAVTKTYSYPSSATLTATETSAAQSAFPAGQSGVIVSVSYTHQPMFFSQMSGTWLASTMTAAYLVTQLKS